MWSDLERSTQVSKKLQQIKNKLAVYDKTVKAVDDVEEFKHFFVANTMLAMRL